mgnify:CR=1 FL=1
MQAVHGGGGELEVNRIKELEAEIEELKHQELEKVYRLRVEGHKETPYKCPSCDFLFHVKENNARCGCSWKEWSYREHICIKCGEVVQIEFSQNPGGYESHTEYRRFVKIDHVSEWSKKTGDYVYKCGNCFDLLTIRFQEEEKRLLRYLGAAKVAFDEAKKNVEEHEKALENLQNEYRKNSEAQMK